LAVGMVVATPLVGVKVEQALAHGHFLTVMPKA